MSKAKTRSATAAPQAILAQAHRLMEAQALSDAAAMLEPLDGMPEADFLRAGLMLALEHPEQAEPLFRRVLAVAPHHLDTTVGLAGSLVAQGRATEALPLLKQAVAAQPDSGRIAYLAGVALDEAGMTEAARAQLSKARTLVIAPALRRGLVPYEMHLQLSRRCNLHCSMCGWEVWKNNTGFMEEEVFARALAEAKACNIRTIHVLAGQGEPFLHPRAFELLERMTAEGFEVGVVTNGTPFTPERIVRLAGLGLAYLQFSFTGWDAESYESVYVGAKFAKVLANLKAIHAALAPTRTRFAVKAVAQGDWEESLRKTKTFLAGHGITDVFTVKANNFGGTVRCGRHFERFGVWSLKDLDHHRPMPCRLFLKSVGIFCDGTVTACGCYDSNGLLKIGDILEDGLAAIRNGKAYTDILEAFAQGDVRHVPMCGACDDPFG